MRNGLAFPPIGIIIGESLVELTVKKTRIRIRQLTPDGSTELLSTLGQTKDDAVVEGLLRAVVLAIELEDKRLAPTEKGEPRDPDDHRPE